MKAKNRINFTHKALHALPLPAPGKRAVYFDEQVKGLNLIVTDKGNKSFYVRKVIDGVSRRIRLGAFPDLSVENARGKANNVKAAIANNQNPYEEEQRRKGEPTLTEFFEEYKERHAIPHKKPSSLNGDEHHFSRHIKDRMGNRKLSSISREDIEDLHREIGKKTKYSANRVLALLRTVFSKAIEWGRMKGDNPASRVRPFAEKTRDRFLQGEELHRFFMAIKKEKNKDIRDFVLLCLYTGARKSNVLSMRWDALNFEHGIWRIEETKNGDSLHVPLLPPALHLLRRRKRYATKKAVYVFPGTGKTGHMVEPKNGWKRLLKEANITGLRVHDLRRTQGSHQALTGASQLIIGKSLGHKTTKATEAYAHFILAPVFDAMDASTRSILTKPKKPRKEKRNKDA